MSDSSESIYDNVDTGVSWFKPEDAGEILAILITEITQEESAHRNTDGTPRVGLTYKGLDAAGARHGWTAWSARAKRACLVDKPEVGDFTRFQYDGEEPMSGGLNPAKNWTVKVLWRKGEVELDADGFPIGF